MNPLVCLFATVGALVLLACALVLLGWWRDRRWDPEAELRLRRHAERKAAENGRPKADVTVTPVTPRRRP